MGGRPQHRGARVALLTLGRETATGEQRRVASWTQALTNAGAYVVPIPLLLQARRTIPSARALVAVLRGRTAPETLSWSISAVNRLVKDAGCSSLVAVTLRAYDPGLGLAPNSAALDFVDSLGTSYRQRQGLVQGSMRVAGYRVLSAAHRRLEIPGRVSARVRLAAGFGDADRLGAEWFPNLSTPLASGPGAWDHDFVFVGNLQYPPNVEAVDYLAQVWPEISRRRPGATLLVAGRQPVERVRRLCGELGWTLEADFLDPVAVARRGRISLVPIRHQSGISNKVLDAASAGVPLVVFPEALAGMARGFPAVEADATGYVDAALALLDDPRRQVELAEAAQTEIRERYSVEAWADWCASLLDRLH